MATNAVLQPVNLPQPIRLHWAMVLIASAVTGGLFGALFLVVQAAWVRKTRATGIAFTLTIGYTALVAANLVSDLAARFGRHSDRFDDALTCLMGTFWIAAVYTLRYELEREPINLWIGKVMPLFFGPVYFQYHLMDWQAGGARSAGKTLGLG
jgi:hypothetical protein